MKRSPPGYVLQEHVDLGAVLEGEMEINGKRVPHAEHGAPFRINTLRSPESDDLRFTRSLKGETAGRSRLVGGTAESNEQRTPKSVCTCGLWDQNCQDQVPAIVVEK